MTEADKAVTVPDADPLAPIPAVHKPDEQEHQKTLTRLNSEIEELNKKKERIQNKIEASKKANDELNARINEARELFNKLKDEQSKIKTERSLLMDERESLLGPLDKTKGDDKGTREKSKYRSVEDIKRRLNELTMKQSTESMSVREETLLVREIEALEKEKRTLQQSEEARAKVAATREANKARLDELRTKIAALSEILAAKTPELNAQFAAMKEYQDQRDKARNDFPELSKERDGVRVAVDAAYTELKKAKSDFYHAQKAYEQYQGAVRRQEYLRKQKERQERAAAAKAAQEAGAPESPAAPAGTAAASGGATTETDEFQPYREEIALCDMVINYLERLKPKSSTASSASAASAAIPTAALVGLKGEKLTASNRGGDDEYAALMGAGSKGKRQKAAGVAVSANGLAAVKPQPLTFGLDTLSSFKLLDVRAPATTAELDETIAAVRAKREYYETAPPPEPKPAEASHRGAAGGVASGPAAADGLRNGSGKRGNFESRRGGKGKRTGRPAVDFVAGTIVKTPYGAGIISEVRPNGSVVVKMTSFFATGYLQKDQVTAAS